MGVQDIGSFKLPNHWYFEGAQNTMRLGDLATYAAADRFAREFNSPLGPAFNFPLRGPIHYSPGAGGNVVRMFAEPDQVRFLGGQQMTAQVITSAGAILGVGKAPTDRHGRRRAEVAQPVMGAKAGYFLWTAGVPTNSICVSTELTPHQEEILRDLEKNERNRLETVFRAENFVGTARALLPNAWFTNFEDLSGEEVGIVWKHLQDRVGQASWWSDDVDGTGVVTAGGVLSWADITGRRLDNIKVVIFGAGAGGSGVYQQLINNGVKPENILVTDTGPDKDDSGTPHPIHEGRTDVADNFFKAAMRKGKSAQVSVDEFLKGADLVINLGDKKTILRDRNWTLNLIKGMAKDGLILFLTNPDPGLYPDEVEEVRSDLFVGTGNNRYKNPFNNFVVFGYAGLASLLARISVIDGRLTVPLAQGVHQVAKMGQPEFYQGRRIKNRISYGRDWLVPSPDDLQLIKHEAGSGAKAAIHAGLSTLLGEHPTDAQVKALLGEVDARIDYQMRYVEWLREESRRRAVITSKMTYPKRHAPFSMNKGDDPEYYTVPEVSEEEFNIAAEALGISPKDQKTIMGDDGRLKTTALTLLLKRINSRQVEGQDEVAAKKELRIILDLAYVSPALGLAVALKRASLKTFPEGQVSIFHDRQVMDVVSRVVPNIVLDVRLAFRELRAER